MVAKRRPSSSPFAHKKAICAAVAACFNASATYANPTAPQVVAGQATFNTQGPLLNVTNAPGTVIHWQRFSIGAGETTRFVQQSAQSAVLNRVITADPSVLLGTLSSNGKVFLINPSGILVGAGGRVDVAGFVASTLNITNEDFAAGRLRFQPVPNAGSVVNEGVITSPTGGHVYLVAPNVTNAGVIATPKGEAILAAGNQVELLDTGTPGVRVQIDVPGGEARNVGQIVADSGRIGIVGALVQNRGRVSADQVVGDASGRVFLKASKTVTLASGSSTTANGARGGDIQISGDGSLTVEKDAIVQANGTEAGGSIQAASSAATALIAGSLQATGSSQGGAIRVASGAGAQIDGQLLASATTGRGGAITVSSGGPLNVTALSALDASGAAGGTISMNAADSPVAVDGTIDATGTAGPGGRIDVIAATDVTIGDSGKLRAPGTQGGTVYIEARRDNNATGTTSLAGLLDVFGNEGEGGKALLLGPRVAIVRNGAIEASGKRGGGIALVGGDYQGKNADVPNAGATYVGPDTSIKADATLEGDGGKVIVWSDEATRAYGSISARGGARSGKGGFVETSGHYLDVDGIRVDVSAAAGATGTWLLDPTDLELNNDTTDTNISRTPTFKPSASGAKLRWATIKNNLDTSDVSVTTSGSTDSSGETGAIKIKSGTSYNSSHNLSITSASGIDVEAEIANSGNGAVSLTASGTVNFKANVSTGSSGLSVVAANANFSSGTTKINGSYSVSGTTTINGGTATFDANASAPTLTLSSGTLGGSGTVSTDNLSWTGGTLLGSLTLNSGKNGALSAGAKAIGSSASAATFTNRGTITDSTPGGSASLQLYGSSAFNNQGVYSFTTDASIDNPNGNGVITNTGSFTKSGGTGTSTISAKFVNTASSTGGVTVSSGVLKFAPPSDSSASHTGSFTVSSGATLQFDSGTQSFINSVSGAGTVKVSGGTFNFNSGSYSATTTAVAGGTMNFNVTTTASALKFSGGSLGGSGSLTANDLDWSGGTLLGSLTLASNKTGTLSAGAKAIGNSASAATFTNKGTITDSTPGGSASLQLYSSSAFNNQGVYSFTTDAGIDNPNGSGVINNTGSFTKSAGTGTSTISAKFVNAADSTATGAVKVNSGTLKFSPPSSTSASHAGSFDVASGATLDFSNGTHDVSGAMSGAGDLAVNGGTLNVKGAFSMSGRMSMLAGTTTLAPTNGAMTPASVNLGGGAVKFNGDVNTPTFTFTSGTLGGSGVLKVTNAFSRSGGTMDGTIGGLDVTQETGELAPGIFAVNGNVSLATKAGGLKLDSLSGTKIVGKAAGGDLTLNSGGTITASGSSDALVLVSGGNFINNAGGSAMSAPNGRWLVYSKDPTLDSRGALAYDFKQYGATYDGTAYSGQGKGNGFLYSVAPTLTASLIGSAVKTYDGTTAAALAAGNIGTSGALDGDTVSYDTSVAPAYADKNAGAGKTVSTTVTLAGAANGAAKVYGYQLSKGNISGGIGKIEKASLTFSATAADKVYDATTAATVSFDDNRVRNDVLTISYSGASFADKTVGKAKTVTIAGIALAGTDAGNYSYDTTATAKASITQASATISGLAANNKVYDASTAATVNAAAATIKGVFAGDAVTLVGGTASFADKNVGTAKPVTAKGYSLDGADAANYALTQPSGLTADITPATLTATGLTAAGKVYDGTTTATLSGGTLSGVLGNDVVRAALSGAFSDKNAGTAKSVKASAVLSGPEAANYTFVSPSGVSADITPKPLSTWIGSTGGLWSNSANWDHGIVPDASNVVAVSIPTVRDSVVYDASAGNTTLRNLDSGMSVVLKGGVLTLGTASTDVSTIRSGASLELQPGTSLFVNGALNAAAYVQSGGALAGTGNLTVSSQFAQTGGSITLTGAGTAALNQAAGNLSVGSLAAPTITLAALNGAIGQSAAIAASTLTATAANGITLTNAANKIGSFTAKNTGNGNLLLTNGVPLTIPSLTNSGGNITIDNVGAVTTFGEVTAPAGAVTITAHSPLAIGPGGVFASGDIVLSAGQSAGSGDNLNVSGIVNSTAKGGAITLIAGDDLFQNANVTSNGGNVTASAQTGNISMALGASTSSAGGAVAYAAPAGSIALTRLDADSGAIAVTSGLNTTSTSGYAGANLVGKSAIITSGGNAILSTNVQQLQTRVSGTYSVLDVVTGNVATNVSTTSAPLQQAEQSIVTAVISSTKTTASSAASTAAATTLTSATTGTAAATTTASTNGQTSSSSSAATGAASSAASSTTAVALAGTGTGSSALPVKTDPNGTIGGAPNEFGGTQLASASAPTKTAAAETSGGAADSSTKTEGGQRSESKDGPQQKRVAQAAEKRSEAKSATKKAAVCR